MSKFGEEIEKQIKKIVIDAEYEVGKINNESGDDEFEDHIDLLNNEPIQKQYKWMSNIPIPEFASLIYTQNAIDVGQYGKTKNFVEAYVLESDRKAETAADAAEECINKTLNQRHMHHLLKYARARLLATSTGPVYFRAWWEQDINQEEVGRKLGNDGEEQPVYDYQIIKDQFNYEVYDRRNVFTDNVYTYTIQDKDWIIFRSDTNLYDLKQDAEREGYFNLDLIEDWKGDEVTETQQKTRDPYNDITPVQNTMARNMDKLIRYGRFWYKDGKPGLDDNGNPLEGATLERCIITFVSQGGKSQIIGFHLSPYIDYARERYYPIGRGLCYIHPTDDNGVSDGKYAKPLQVAINDTFNISQDRVQLATIPTFKGEIYQIEETDQAYIEPGHVIPLANPGSLEELRITDNIQGALHQEGVLQNKMHNVMGVFPGDVGQLPDHSSTTATAVVNAGRNSDARSNYKALIFELTYLSELYWMILQMTKQLAQPETAKKLMGKLRFDFNPKYDIYYKPVSASIDSDNSRNAKMQLWQRNMQIAGSIPHPNSARMVNFAWGKMCELSGDEFDAFKYAFLDENTPIQHGQQAPQAQGEPVSNQNMLPMSSEEQTTREAVNE